ncbi:RagB/SusD family nutrient uptake outer membrane protein [Algoriphagus sediminis]|uniref:RagB/SusD family nutrient uptake outer membrane protein n=1 Tax=Algoriphagus sediminis TaxID=3057113 RepID=A0ABT7YH18_9BACT|nr:RagB/SusD family nutrient uptake outer membrane protein [Algoriphagus sediminis]MDN3205808.1 RagB/SusD family nutrient uptake outer membrane protein [Algoriphagus sediminis]
MKNYIKVLALGAVMSFTACDGLLDTDPRQSLTPESGFADASGYEALIFAAYGQPREFNLYGQQMMMAPEIMADNLRIIANTGRYIGQEVNADRAHMGIWNGAQWGAINETNILLAGIDEVEGDENLKTRLKGEAHFLRALMYFDFARIYGYEPGQEVNGWNLTVPLRTTPTLGFSDADFRERATNTELYAQIESDLQMAISMLPTADAGSAGVYRASKGAAEALLARVFLYGGKNAEAASMATQAMATFGLGDDGTGLVDAGSYVSGFSTFPNPESLFEIEIRSVDWSTVDGVNNSMCTLMADAFASAQFIATASDELLDAYEEGDVRRDTWTETTRSGADGVVYRSNKWLGAKGDFLENLPIIRAPELYLIRAEARYKTGDEAGARADLTALRSKRGLGPAVGSGSALFDLIMNERRVEFAVEGHRWFDLKRNGMDITKHNNFETVPYTDYRILAPLPQGELILNELLVDNPGYN